MFRFPYPLRCLAFAALLTGLTAASCGADGGVPLALHPENPRYALFRGKPALLVTSGEHYGAVLNTAFDYRKYLETLAMDGLNLTRTFSGAYLEPPGAFNIAENTLAPAGDRFLCPWARSGEPGFALGGNKFDLTAWDPAYFERLRDFMEAASARGVVVEYVFFCPFYKDDQWLLSPQNAANNVNGVGKVDRESVYTLDRNGGLLAVHEALVRKVVRELNGFDNLYYEICNEPYFGGVTLEWQHRIAEVIVETEKELPRRHLISQNVANGRARVEDPHPAVSIFNFHYATPPDTVVLNAHLGKLIGDNETGFKGTADRHYRMEGWEFLLAGGGLYNNLDYSFTAGREDGTFRYPETQPGGGGTVLRRQLGALKRFVEESAFWRMEPRPELVRSGVPDGQRVQVLAEPGRDYLIYLTGGAGAALPIELPAGTYQVRWFDPLEARWAGEAPLEHGGGEAILRTPPLAEDAACRIRREKGE